MKWQDVVLTVGSVMFLFALAPSIFSAQKPAPITSALTGGVLFVFAGTYLTLHLTFSSIVTAVTACAWIVLLIQVKCARLCPEPNKGD